MNDLTNLQDRISYQFQNRKYLEHALTHSSYANEHHKTSLFCNERLEFLGDSILGQITAEYLYRIEPAIPEGAMSKLRSELVCENALFAVAKKLQLGQYLFLGKGETNTGGRSRPSILADAIEAIIAAIYLDGGYEAARRFVHEKILPDELDSFAPTGDWKTELQELVQKNPNRTIKYKMISESGPDHDKRFTFGVWVDDKLVGQGNGRTKKEAEQFAAKNALEYL